MARKLVLVDEQMYNALINSADANRLRQTPPPPPPPAFENNVDDDKTSFIRMKDNAEKALKKRRRNLSTKNLLYQQELRRYLKARKKLQGKPVHVKFNDRNIFIKPSADKSKTNVGIMTESGDVMEEEIFKTPTKIYEGTLKQEKEEKEGIFSDTPKRPTQEEEERIPLSHYPKILFQHVMGNKETYGISEEGKLMRGSLKLKTAEVDDIINHFFNKKPGTASPPGYKTLEPKLLRDPNVKHFLDQYKLQEKDEKVSRKTSSSYQRGKGNVRRSPAGLLFRPSKW